MSRYSDYSRGSYTSRQSDNEHGDRYGDSSRGYNDYSDDYRAEGRYADNRRLIDKIDNGHPSPDKYTSRYDDLIDSRRDTNRYSNSLGGREDPYSRMGGYNDNYDGEYRNPRASRNIGSRNPFEDPIDRYGNSAPRSSYNDTDNNQYKASAATGGANYRNNSTTSRISRYEDTDHDPDNRYGASFRNRSPDDDFEHGRRYRSGGKSFDEVNAGYGYALKDDKAARRYKPEDEDR